MMFGLVDVSDMLGKTMSRVARISEGGDESIDFWGSDGEKWSMFHAGDCCENVWIEDVAGDLDDLVDSPIVLAEESTNSEEPPVDGYGNESYTWTFYKFATAKGYVTIRWFGTSNGYYSETASVYRVKETP